MLNAKEINSLVEEMKRDPVRFVAKQHDVRAAQQADLALDYLKATLPKARSKRESDLLIAIAYESDSKRLTELQLELWEEQKRQCDKRLDPVGYETWKNYQKQYWGREYE